MPRILSASIWVPVISGCPSGTLLGSVEIDSETMSLLGDVVGLRGNFLYVSLWDPMDHPNWYVYVVDVSTPSAPSLVGYATLPTSWTGPIDGGGQPSYVDTGTGGVAPIACGTYSYFIFYRDLEINDGLGGFLGYPRLGMIIVDSSGPTDVNEFRPWILDIDWVISGYSPYVIGCRIDDTHIAISITSAVPPYGVSDDSTEFWVLGISGASNPTKIAHISAPGYYDQIVSNGTHVFCATDQSHVPNTTTIDAYDVTTPASPFLVGSITIASNRVPVRMVIDGTILWVFEFDNGTSTDWVRAIDISTPSSLSQISDTEITPISVTDIAAMGNCLWMPDLSNSVIDGLDISVPAVPVITGTTVSSPIQGQRILSDVSYVYELGQDTGDGNDKLAIFSP